MGRCSLPWQVHTARGRWPIAPGEVAVSGDPAARPGINIVVGGINAFTVTGIVDDLYAEKTAVLAAPGSWARLDPALGERYETMRAQPFVYWSGGTDTAVLDAIAASLSSTADTGNRADLDNSYAVAPPSEEQRSTPWIDKLPIAYLIPASLFPALTVAVALSVSESRAARLRRVAHGLGIPAGLVTAHYLIVSGFLTAGAAAGAALGTTLPHLARASLERAAGRPVDLDVELGWPLARYVIAVAASSVVLAYVAGAIPAWRSRRASLPGVREGPTASSTKATPPLRWRRITGREMRQLVAVALVCLGVASSPSVDAPGTAIAAATPVVLAALLLQPDLLRLLLRGIPAKRWNGRLARARLRSRFGIALATTMTLALAIGITFGYLVVLQTWLTTANGDRAPVESSRVVYDGPE